MIDSFLKKVLGVGGPVIKNLMKSAPETRNVVIPRTIMAWIKNLGEHNEATIPGTDVRFCFVKTESGWAGGVDLKKNGVHCFYEADEAYLASVVMVALEAETINVDLIKNIDIARLGKTIDLLVKNVADKPIETPVQAENDAQQPKIQPLAPQGPTMLPKTVGRYKNLRVPKADTLLQQGDEAVAGMAKDEAEAEGEAPEELFRFLKD